MSNDNEKKNNVDSKDQEFNDIMLNLAWKRFEQVFNDKRDIEQKTSLILTANGVLLGLVANGFNVLSKGSALLGLIAIFFSSLFCIISLKPREYLHIGVNESWESLKNYKPDIDKVKMGIFGTIAANELINRNNVKSAANWFEYAIWSFLLSVSLIIIALIDKNFF